MELKTSHIVSTLLSSMSICLLTFTEVCRGWKVSSRESYSLICSAACTILNLNPLGSNQNKTHPVATVPVAGVDVYFYDLFLEPTCL